MNVDVTCYYNGYHGDLNETFPVGNIDAGSKELIQTTYECLQQVNFLSFFQCLCCVRQAIAMCRPGVLYRDIGTVISKHARLHGLSVVKTFTGHGIGRYKILDKRTITT